MNPRSLAFLLLAPLVAFFLPWAIPLRARRRRSAAALFALWIAGLAVAGLLWFGPGVIVLALAGVAGLLVAGSV